MSQFDFQKKYTFEQRQGEADRILRKYPDRIPVIVEKSKVSSGSIPDIDKHKYLVPMDLTVGQFVYIIRKRLILPSDQAIFIFINNSLPPTTAVMSDLYHQHKELDNFLYFSISGESTFGNALRDLGNA